MAVALSGGFARFARQLLGRAGPPAGGDWALWQAARDGDERSARMLVGRLAPQALALARGFLRRDEDAEDAVQESFVRLWRSRPDAGRGGSLATYFNTIVLNRCRTRAGARVDLPTEQADLEAMLEREQADAATGGDAFEALALTREEANRRLQAALDALPPRQRLAIAMWAYADADADAIAQALGLTTNAAHQLLHRARRSLRAGFQE